MAVGSRTRNASYPSILNDDTVGSYTNFTPDSTTLYSSSAAAVPPDCSSKFDATGEETDGDPKSKAILLSNETQFWSHPHFVANITFNS